MAEDAIRCHVESLLKDGEASARKVLELAQDLHGGRTGTKASG